MPTNAADRIRTLDVGVLTIESGLGVVVDPGLLISALRRRGLMREALDAIESELLQLPTLDRTGSVTQQPSANALHGAGFSFESDGDYVVRCEYDTSARRLSRVVIDVPEEPEA